MPSDTLMTSDPKRSLDLLWGRMRPPSPSRRGPKPRLTAEVVAASAVELADAEGLPAIAMRRMAERLGVATMSLYTYVPGKAELVDLMLDHVHAEPVPRAEGSPREHLAATARAAWSLHRRHPWMLEVGHAPLGPNRMARYERDLRGLEGVGLSDLEMGQILALVSDYVAGAVRSARATQAPQEAASLPDEMLDAGRFPAAVRVGAARLERPDPDAAFEFGLARLLDGLDALIAARRA